MEKKINIAELLKDCPRGMELDCVSYDNVSFDKISDDKKSIYPIFCYITDKEGNRSGISFTKNGCESKRYGAKCVIFPKGKTTWEGFIPPFKDGDVVATMNGSWIGITKGGKNNDFIPTYCVIDSNDEFEAYLDRKKEWAFNRLATEEEKEKLFQAIKDNGYKWNPETKTLEKVVESRFHAGDWITDGISKYQILFIDDIQYWYSENGILGSIESVDKRYHHWTIQDAEDGDVLATNWREGDDSWEKIVIFKKYHNVEGFVEGYGNTFMNRKLVLCDEVPYFSKTWTGTLQPATKEQRDFLFQKIKEAGYEWNPKTKTLDKIKPKFKVNDQVKHIYDKDNRVITIIGMKEEYYDIIYFNNRKDDFQCEKVLFADQDKYELIPNKFDITSSKKATQHKFKVGDRIKHRCGEIVYRIVQITEGSYVLDNHCSIPISMEYMYNLIPNKFDINTLKPFDKVLVRDTNGQVWTADLFSHIIDTNPNLRTTFVCTGHYPNQCIPYEGNEHLLGTTDDCDEYFKIWEN